MTDTLTPTTPVPFRFLSLPREEAIEVWAKALESGEYKQARSFLRTDAGFCCLGVACDLVSRETGEDWDWEGMEGESCFRGETVCLPDEIEAFLAGEVDLSVFSALANGNDSGKTFPELAKIIRQRLLNQPKEPA